MEENKKHTEKDKKYHIILGVMLFLFVIFVGICIAFGLGIIGTSSNKSNTIDKEQENIAIYDEHKEDTTNNEVNNTNTNVETTNPTNPSIDENKNTNSTIQENTNTNTATNTNSEVVNQNSSSNNTTNKVESENTGNDIAEDLDDMSQILGNQLLQAYNNKILTGTQVKSAIMQYIDSEDMTIVLINANTNKMVATTGSKKLSQDSIVAKNGYYEISSDKYSAEGGTLHKTSMDDFNNAENEAYVGVVKRYNAYLLTLSGTTDVVGIVFVG